MKTLGADRWSSQRRSRPGICLAGVLAIASWIGSPGVAADGPAAAALTVHFIGLKTSQGAVMAALYNSEAAYENSGTASEAATRTVKLEIKDGAAVTTLADLPSSTRSIRDQGVSRLERRCKTEYQSFWDTH